MFLDHHCTIIISMINMIIIGLQCRILWGFRVIQKCSAIIELQYFYSLYLLLKIFYCVWIVRWDWDAKILVFVWGPQKSKNHSIHFYVSDEFSTFIKMARHTVSAPKTPITEFLVSPHDGKNMPILSTVRVPYSDNNCWVFSKKKTKQDWKSAQRSGCLEEICNWAITRPDWLE